DLGHFELFDELCFEMDVEPIGAGEGEPALEQPSCRAEVATPPGAPAGEAEALAGSERERGVVLAQLGEVTSRLLEVVTQDLLELDQALPVLLEPGREATVEIGAGRLRKRLVRGVADQQMPEAIGVVTRELCAVRTDELLAHERDQPLVDG